MKLYRRINANIEAVQYEPDRGVTEFAEFVSKFCEEMSMNVVEGTVTAVVKLKDPNGGSGSWVHVRPGSWLMRLEDGRVCGCSDDYFREEFETV
jgi:hypothetical protein